MKCENLGRVKRISIPGRIMGSQCQSGNKRPSQSREAYHKSQFSPPFSRQEYWSGSPFPSPVHESEKSKCKTLQGC